MLFINDGQLLLGFLGVHALETILFLCLNYVTKIT